MDDDQFFAAPPAEEAPPAGEDGGFTLLGDAGETMQPAAYVGDVQEGDDMGFAGTPTDDAFAAPPVDDDFGMADDAPIVLGPPPEAAEESPDALDAGADDVAAVGTVATVPSAMQKWNEEWQLALAARKDEENAKKAEHVEAARVALEEFQKERELKREAKMAKNREDEQAKLEAIEADLENDNSWQRVCKLVDLTHDKVEAGEDTKKMRDIFILLKNEQGLAAKVGA